MMIELALSHVCLWFSYLCKDLNLELIAPGSFLYIHCGSCEKFVIFQESIPWKLYVVLILALCALYKEIVFSTNPFSKDVSITYTLFQRVIKGTVNSSVTNS